MADVKVTKDEADQRQFDALAVEKKDPKYHYRWARDRDMAVALHKFHGYEVVDSKSGERSILDDGTRMKKGSDTDSSIRVGDLILMRTSQENYERRLKDEQEKIRRVTKGVGADFVRRVNQAGGPGVGYEEHRENKGMKG